VVERVGRQIGTARPDDGPGLGINGDLREPLGRTRLLEHRTAHAVKHVDLASNPVSEGEPQDRVTNDYGGRDVWR
jgi:hypothetical protein